MNIQRVKTQRAKGKVRRQSVNVSIRSDVVAEAKKLGLNMSEIAEHAVVGSVKAAAVERWKANNAAALKAHRDRVDNEGALLDDLRTF